MVIRLPGIIIRQKKDLIEVDVTQKIISLNQFLGAPHGNKRRTADVISWNHKNYQKYKRDWAKALNIVPTIKRRKIKSYVTVISYRKRLIDKENLYGGSKPIRDTLERKGWVWNDSPAWGDLTVWQTHPGQQGERTNITIWLKE